jgi:cysteinyl-tRNA synthetase
MFTLTNTASGKKEELIPINPGKIKVYVCGVTPYSASHIGQGRCYVAFDVLYRVLKFLGYDITYCRNFTDIDDKLLNKAQEQLGDKFKYKQIADKWIAAYHDDMRRLNCLPPTFEPRVTDNIPEIISFIAELIEKRHAYEVDGDVYFDISSFPDYGILSKHKLEDLRAGARVDVREQKRDPLDFALWKSESEGTFWQSPWGYGRPGWHIECSALAYKFLGEHIDIHGGGMDLVFPHHENEIAQSESLFGAPFAQYWVHNGFVTIDKEKMSKSLGNTFSLKEICEQFDPMVIRFYLINHQYRAPLDFSKESIEAAQKTYQRLCKAFEPFAVSHDTAAMKELPIIQAMLEFLCDDLNTVGLMGILFEHLKYIVAHPQQASLVKGFIIDVLGLPLEPLFEPNMVITPKIQRLLDERTEARNNRNWARADAIRDELAQMGFDVQDKKSR